MAEEVFLRLPVPGKGEPWDFVSVDLSRYDLSTASKLYRRQTSVGRGASEPQYFPMQGRTALPREMVSLDHLAQLVEQECAGLSLGEEEEAITDLASFSGSVNALIAAVAHREQMQAQDAIRGLVGSLRQLLDGFTSVIHSTRGEMQALEELANGAAEDAEARAMQDPYLKWSLAAERLRTTCRSYAMEARIVRELADQSDRSIVAWTQQLSETDGAVAHAVAFLDPPNGEGFVTRTFLFEAGQISPDVMRSDILRAEGIIEACEALQRKAMLEYESLQVLRRSVCGETNEADTPRRRAEDACARMVGEQRALRLFLETYHERLGPHEGAEGLISAECYDEAVSFVPPTDGSRHEWYHGTCRETLRRDVQRISNLHEPKLPSEVCVAIRTARERIAVIKRLQQPPASVRSSSPGNGAGSVPRSEPSRPVAVAPSSDGSSKADQPTPTSGHSEATINEGRFTELYELAVCVAHVVASEHASAALTIRGMLRVLVALGRCSVEESETYREALTSYIGGQSRYAEDVSRACQLRTRSSSLWVHFPGYKHSWKRMPTAVGTRNIRALLEKHSLSPRYITEAKQRSSEEWRRKQFGSKG